MNSKDEYRFPVGVEKQLKAAGAYLQRQGYKAVTIRQKLNYTGLYLLWMESERLIPSDVRYTDLLSFVDHLRDSGKSTRHVNTIILAVRNYYEWLKETAKATANPASSLYLRGIRRKIPSGILSFETLEKLYGQYPVRDHRSARNRVMLGLIIYQGLTSGELHHLTTNHIKLKEGKIQVPGDARSHGRILELKAFQVIELHDYITRVRPALLHQADTPKPYGRTASKTRVKETDRLFISVNGSSDLKNSLHHLFCFIQKLNPEIKSAGQIRQSVIVHWLKSYNLRQVQYMVGHRWVSSTERYRLDNLEGLQAELDKYHPLG